MPKPLRIGGYCRKNLHLLDVPKSIYTSKPGKRQCASCKQASSQRYLESNREKLLANGKKWHLANRSHALKKGRDWKSRNKERNYLNNRQSHLKRAFGISLADQQDLAVLQRGLCPICETSLGSRPLVDHDHLTGKVRGLLCRKCNTGPGQFKDTATIVRRALQYLEFHDEKGH